MWAESLPAALQSFELMLHSHINVSFPPNFYSSHTWRRPHMFFIVETFCNHVGHIFPLQSFCPDFFLPTSLHSTCSANALPLSDPLPSPSFLSRGWFHLSRLFIYLFTSLTLECHFAVIAFDLVIISPHLSVGPVSPRPTVFRTFLSLPSYNFIAHHRAVFFMFILLGIYQACEICRFVVIFLNQIQENFGHHSSEMFSALSASLLSEILAARMADHCWFFCLWSLGLWYLQTFYFSFPCFCLRFFSESSRTLILSKRHLTHEHMIKRWWSIWCVNLAGICCPDIWPSILELSVWLFIYSSVLWMGWTFQF